MLIRRILPLALVLLVGACTAVGWLALRQRDAQFIAPGAYDLQVVQAGVGGRVIRYRMAQPELGWASTIARRLSLSGWSITFDRYAWGDTANYVPTYTRTSQFWLVRVRERAELRGARDAAEITVTVRVDFRL
jgi:hypothetical protein